MMEVYIPSVGNQVYKADKTRTVFKLDVLFNGRRHTLDRRYSEFHTLHKLLKKTCKVPDFPPKRVPKWMSKVQEQRRQGLEAYIQGVLWFNQEVPKELLDFLKVKHFPQGKKNCSLDTLLADITPGENRYCLLLGNKVEETSSPSSVTRPTPNECKETEKLSQLAHKAVVGFYKDLYISPPDTAMVEDIVLQGVIQGLYQQTHKNPPVAKQKLPTSNPVP